MRDHLPGICIRSLVQRHDCTHRLKGVETDYCLLIWRRDCWGVTTLASTFFGRTVRSRREIYGLTQEELAEMAEIHPTYVGLVERGKRNPSLDIAARIADALNLTVAELICNR